MYTSYVLYKTIWNFIDKESIQSDNKWSCNSIFSLVNYFYLGKKSAIYCTRNWLGEESASLLGRWWIRDESRTLSRARPDRFPHRRALIVLCRQKEIRIPTGKSGKIIVGGGWASDWWRKERKNERTKKKEKKKEEENVWMKREGGLVVPLWWGRAENQGNRHQLCRVFLQGQRHVRVWIY